MYCKLITNGTSTLMRAGPEFGFGNVSCSVGGRRSEFCDAPCCSSCLLRLRNDICCSYCLFPFLSLAVLRMIPAASTSSFDLVALRGWRWRRTLEFHPARFFLRRKLSTLQWMAIVLLTVGTTTSQVKGCGEASCDSLFSAPIQGYMFGLLSACLSALAGVYTEYLMKKNNDTLYWQNVQLYTFGAIFNMARLMMDDFRVGLENGPWWQRLLNGYTVTTWLVVLNLGSSGLLVSWLMKYADNIVK
ncbi:hypothetical protein MUK42_34436, partial [Musa troglodytarum]